MIKDSQNWKRAKEFEHEEDFPQNLSILLILQQAEWKTDKALNVYWS